MVFVGCNFQLSRDFSLFYFWIWSSSSFPFLQGFYFYIRSSQSATKLLCLWHFSSKYLEGLYKAFEFSQDFSLIVAWVYHKMYYIIVIKNGKIVWKHRPYCWYFRFNFKYLVWLYRAYIKTAKHGNFCKEFLSENDL